MCTGVQRAHQALGLLPRCPMSYTKGWEEAKLQDSWLSSFLTPVLPSITTVSHFVTLLSSLVVTLLPLPPGKRPPSPRLDFGNIVKGLINWPHQQGSQALSRAVP